MRASAYGSLLPGMMQGNGSAKEVFVLRAGAGADRPVARVALCPLPGASPAGRVAYRASGRT